MYLDPGFGGMLVQVIVTLVATGGVALFAFRKKIGKLFSKNKNKADESAENIEMASTDDNDVIDLMDKTEK